MLVAILTVSVVIGALLVMRADLKVWLITLGPLAILALIVTVMVLNPCMFHGGPGNAPTWLLPTPGTVICADGTALRLPWASTP